MNAKEFVRECGRVCEEFGARPEGERWVVMAVETAHGPLEVKAFEDWISLRFLREDEALPKGVFSRLHGRDYNGHAGKWNIRLTSKDVAAARREMVSELRRSLLVVRSEEPLMNANLR